MTQPILCRRCGGRCTARWQPFVNGMRHARADCPQCKAFSQSRPQTPEVKALCDEAEGRQRARAAGLFDDLPEGQP